MTLEVLLIVCQENSVQIYQSALRKIPEELRSKRQSLKDDEMLNFLGINSFFCVRQTSIMEILLVNT